MEPSQSYLERAFFVFWDRAGEGMGAPEAMTIERPKMFPVSLQREIMTLF